MKTLPDGGGELYRRTYQGWESFLQYGQADSLTMRPLVIEEGGNTALLLSAVGRDKAALVRVDLTSGKQIVIGQSGKRRRIGCLARSRARVLPRLSGWSISPRSSSR